MQYWLRSIGMLTHAVLALRAVLASQYWHVDACSIGDSIIVVKYGLRRICPGFYKSVAAESFFDITDIEEAETSRGRGISKKQM